MLCFVAFVGCLNEVRGKIYVIKSPCFKSLKRFGFLVLAPTLSPTVIETGELLNMAQITKTFAVPKFPEMTG